MGAGSLAVDSPDGGSAGGGSLPLGEAGGAGEGGLVCGEASCVSASVNETERARQAEAEPAAVARGPSSVGAKIDSSGLSASESASERSPVGLPQIVPARTLAKRPRDSAARERAASILPLVRPKGAAE